jgi:microcystin-dependent protein
MKRIVLMIFVAVSFTAQSQVGIGNQTPFQFSILDLSNDDKFGVVLPSNNLAPLNSTNVPGLVLYNTSDSLIYYTFGPNSTDFNAMTPWKFKYENESSNNVYFNQSSGNVGVGVAPNIGTMPGKLTVFHDAVIAGGPGDNPYLFLGVSGGQQLIMDNDEIMSKTDDATPNGVLQLQKAGGSVEVGADQQADLNVSGKLQERGWDLLPQGAIIMWTGSVVPNGWVLCDGGRYLPDVNGLDSIDVSGVNPAAVATPDLRDRFVVGSGASYAIGNQGGLNTVTLSLAQMPNHSHTGTTSTDSHDHQIPYAQQLVASGASHNAVTNNPAGPLNLSSDSHSHSHTLNINSAGSSAAHENRPPYFAVAYIAKL